MFSVIFSPQYVSCSPASALFLQHTQTGAPRALSYEPRHMFLHCFMEVLSGADPGFQKGGVDGSRRGSTRHLGNYPQDPGNEVVIKPEHRLSTWVGKRERFPANFAIMSQSESYFASLGVVKWLPCELLREKWRQTAKRDVTTTRHERELIFLSLFIFYF